MLAQNNSYIALQYSHLNNNEMFSKSFVKYFLVYIFKNFSLIIRASKTMSIVKDESILQTWL